MFNITSIPFKRNSIFVQAFLSSTNISCCASKPTRYRNFSTQIFCLNEPFVKQWAENCQISFPPNFFVVHCLSRNEIQLAKNHLLLNDIVFPSQEVSQRLSALALCFCNICPTSILWGNDNALCKEAVLPHHHHGKKCSPASSWQGAGTNIIHISYQGSQADISVFMFLLSLAEAANITNYNMIVTW